MIIQWDRGELMSNDVIHELSFEDVESNLTAPYTAHEDCLGEMLNKTIVNNTNSMIKWANCPKLFLLAKEVRTDE